MPQARPAAMARNTARISRAVPGAERKRTSENVPATATPAPMLPLTISITTHTMPGSSASVTAKLLVAAARVYERDDEPQRDRRGEKEKKLPGGERAGRECA